ncbi:MAG TPA: hypothetical protein VNL72_00465 [Gammaproteobacteria bacterium]|nr:hypothetical protein [Gammaproteobacteria bacterium]
MPFKYYTRLTAAQRKIYRVSDAIEVILLPDPVALRPLVPRLKEALAREDRAAVQRVCQAIADGIVAQLGTRPVQVRVLAVRPANGQEELHGFYEGVEGRIKVARISVWMRTAAKRKVVAFRTFLRTFLHELCHHLDYEYLKLPDSFHTEGFYKRESSLFRQLVDEARGVTPPA